MKRNPLTARERIGILVASSLCFLTVGTGIWLRECRHKEISDIPSVIPPAVTTETVLRDSIEDSIKDRPHRKKDRDKKKTIKKKTKTRSMKKVGTTPIAPRNFLNDTVSVR